MCVEEIKKNEAAVFLGRMGGMKTKSKGTEYFRNLSKLGVQARLKRVQERREEAAV